MQGLLFFAPVVAKVGECYPVDTFIAFFNTWYKRSMITPEAWTPVIINSQCSSIKWIERSTEYVLPRIQVFIYIYIYIYIYMIFIYLQRQCFVPWIAALSKFWTNVDQESFVNFELKLFQLRLF